METADTAIRLQGTGDLSRIVECGMTHRL